MSVTNTALALRWFDEVWNQKRGELIDEMVAPEAVCLAGSGELRGPVEFRERVFAPFVAAFPDLHIDVAGIVAQGDEVVVRWTATGTHQGDGLGLPPTGRSVFIRGMTWIRIAGGKFIEGWDCWNLREMIESLK